MFESCWKLRLLCSLALYDGVKFIELPC